MYKSCEECLTQDNAAFNVSIIFGLYILCIIIFFSANGVQRPTAAQMVVIVIARNG